MGLHDEGSEPGTNRVWFCSIMGTRIDLDTGEVLTACMPFGVWAADYSEARTLAALTLRKVMEQTPEFEAWKVVVSDNAEEGLVVNPWNITVKHVREV